MRILINLLNFRPGKIGGTETYLRELVAYLPRVATSEEIVLLTSRDGAREFRDSPLPIAAIPWSTMQICALRFLETAVALFHARSVEAFVENLQPDVVLYPQQSMFPKTVPFPSVLVVHDLYHLHCPQYLTAAQRWYRNRSYPAAVASADHVIAISKFTRRTVLENFSCVPERVSVVAHGIRELAPDDVEPFQGLPGPYLYYPAASLPHKNHEVLFQSIARLRAQGRFAYRLVLTGARTRHWPHLQQLLRRLSLTDTVQHLGYLPYETVLRLVRGAECVLFPSQFEGFGIPVIEAAALDRKVITSRLDVFEEIGVPPARRIDFADLDAFARALADASPARLLRQPSTWSECARGTLEVLRQTGSAKESPGSSITDYARSRAVARSQRSAA